MRRIDIQIKPSKLFILLLAVTTVCCIIIVATLPLSILNKLFISAVVLVYAWFLLINWGLLHGKNIITQLGYGEEGWTLLDRENNIWRGEICGDSTLTPFLGILRFKLEGQRKKRSCLVFKDTLHDDLYRRLMVTVRTAKIHMANA
jgi:hypothetical protein